MNPDAPVTRQRSSRVGSIGFPRRGAWIVRSGAADRRRSVACAMSRTMPQFLLDDPRLSASTWSSAPRKLLASGSESVSGGNSLITSFFPAAMVMTPWSRWSGITMSWGKSLDHAPV